MRSVLSLLAAFALLLPLAAKAELPAKSYAQGEFSYATGPAPAFVIERKVPDSWTAKAGGPWRNWLVDSQIDRRPAKVMAYSDRSYEALTTELLGELARFEVSFNPLYQHLIVHRVEVRRNGTWTNRFNPAQVSLARRESDFENDMSDGSVTALILLSDVRLGDVVRVAYSVEGENPVLADSEVDTFHLGWTEPMLERYVRMVYPATTHVDVRLLGSNAKVERHNAEGRQEVELHLHDVPGYPDEGSYPNWYVRFPLLQVAQDRNWSDVVAWALPLYPAIDSLPAELQAKVQEWNGISEPHERAFAVLRTVQREVRYFGIEMGDSTHKPAPPAQTWARRWGDCKDKAYLVATLLHAVGIDAEPALVSTEWGRGIAEQLPGAAEFNHVIVRARIDGQSFWLDPTLSEQRGDLRTLDVDDYGVALPVLAGATALVPVNSPGKVDNSISMVETYTPAEDGSSIDLRVDTIYTGLRAQYMRVQISAQGMDNLARDYANFYRKRYSELNVADPLHVDDPADSDKLVVSEHYSLPNAWAVHSGVERSLDTYPDALKPDALMPSTPDRSAPLALAHPSTLSHRIVVALPKGWSMQDPPANVNVSAPQFHYRRSGSKSGDHLEVEHRFELLADHVDSSAVAQYLHDLHQVNDDLDLRLSFRMAAARADAERKERLQRLLRDAMDKNKENSK